jgi:CheY-like chemotaxis protein
MIEKASCALRPIGMRRRVLLVGATSSDAERRSEFLRHRGYDVDFASCSEAAIVMTRSHSYDVIVLPVDLAEGCLEKLARRLQRLSPNSTIACLADSRKPIPALSKGPLLWTGEPLEYFLARVDALAATA